MPFPPNKTIKELGIDTTRKFVVVDTDDGGSLFDKGDILVFENEDTLFPHDAYFKRISDGCIRPCRLSRLDYYDEPKLEYTPYKTHYKAHFSTFSTPRLTFCSTSTSQSTNKSNNKPMNIVSLFRELTLSKEDKLMTELGLENPAGTPTADGLQILQELLYAERRADIIEKAKLIKAEMEKE